MYRDLLYFGKIFGAFFAAGCVYELIYVKTGSYEVMLKNREEALYNWRESEEAKQWMELRNRTLEKIGKNSSAEDKN